MVAAIPLPTLAEIRAEQARRGGDRWVLEARPKQLPPPGAWRFWLLMAGRGFGKALALDTLIPTADGWTTMRDAKVGDVLFDERGAPCSVTLVAPVMLGRPCYRLRFSDGSEIVADAEHEWLTVDRRTRKALARRVAEPVRSWPVPRFAPGLVTTADIARTLYDGKEVNHAIPVAGPLALPAVDLPIDPYVLGVWLGDGSSAAAEFTCVDAEIVRNVEEAGYVVRLARPAGGVSATYAIGRAGAMGGVRDGTTGRFVAVPGNVHSDLRALGVLHDKHIPPAYQRASITQRRALLAGLLDTDGSVQPGGHVEYMTTDERLAYGAEELVCGLGFKATLTEERAALYGKDCGPRWRLSFTPHEPVFRLSRKLARQHFGKAQADRVRRRYVVAVDPIPSVPVRCIQVDSPSHLFLAGSAMIPTHNTRTGAEYVRAEVAAGRAAEVMLVAATAADVRDVVVEGPSGIVKVCERAGWRVRYEPSKQRIVFPNGAVARTRSAEEPDRLRGPEADLGWWDEFGAWKDQAAFTNADFGLRRVGPNGDRARAVVTFTPKRTALVRQLVARPDAVVVSGHTSENAANLDPATLASLTDRYGGTSLGRQELGGELLQDVEGAHWTTAMIEAGRLTPADVPPLRRIVVGVDPQGQAGIGSETGIVAAGVGRPDGAEVEHAYVLADDSLDATPNAWARAVLECFRARQADRIVAEVNFGGQMVESTIRTVDPFAPIAMVSASRGKMVRAEPVAALYEQNRAHHVGGFPQLEDEMTGYDGTGPSPNRMDALVWAVTELGLSTPPTRVEVW